MAATMRPDCRRWVTASAARRGGVGVALQHLDADLAGGDLAQRDDGGLVAVGLDQRRRAGADLARAIGRGERELEAVGDALQAVVDGDAGHADLRFFLLGWMISRQLSPWRFRSLC